MERTGYFRLDRHKNVNKGIRARGRLARRLVDYLLSIRLRNAKARIHPNPATGKPYVDIRKQWNRLIEIASDILGYRLVDQKADFFTFRHTGATNMAERRDQPRAADARRQHDANAGVTGWRSNRSAWTTAIAVKLRTRSPATLDSE